MSDTIETPRPPKRGRAIVVTVVVVLAALAAWKVIDHRRQPPPAVFIPTPEGVDALRYLTEAKAAANTISDEGHKMLLLGNIAAAQVKAGDLPGARTSADAMTKDFELMALSRIAVAQAERGDFSGAKATLKALSSGFLKSENFLEGEVLLALATAQAKAGDIAGAKATAASTSEELIRDSALCAVAVAQARAGDIAGAKATASLISTEHFHASPLSDIVIAQLKAGDRAGASTSFDEAEARVKAVKEDRKDVSLGYLARAQAKAGDITRAKATTDAITSFVKHGVMHDIAAIAARAGDIALARVIADSLVEKYQKARVFGDIALAQHRAGDGAGASQTFDEARTVAKAETEDENRDSALCYLAKLQAKSGDVAGAKANVETIKDPDINSFIWGPDTKPFTWRAITGIQARADGLPAAEGWVKTISEPLSRTLCYMALAEARLNPSVTESDDDSFYEH